MKVLIVDDNFHTRRFLQFLLGQLGHEIFTAENGNSGLKLLRNSHYDVVVLDWNMPGMNGRETIEAYEKATPASKQKADIIIYTTYPLSLLKLPKASKIKIRSYISKQLSPKRQLQNFKRSLAFICGQ